MVGAFIDPHCLGLVGAIYSLLGTAKIYGLDPEAYLHVVLERIACPKG